MFGLKKIKAIIRNKFLVLLLGGKKTNLNKFVKSGCGPSLHIGPGNVDLPGWINIDARNLGNTHIVSSDLSLSMFAGGSVDQIYLCHVFEHLSYSSGVLFLKRAYEVLIPGGVIIISVPDFDRIIDAYNKNDKNLNSIKSALMGGQNYSENYHLSMYNRSYLATVLQSVGFVGVIDWSTSEVFGQSVGDWSDRLIPTSAGELPISLNLKGSKPI